MKKLRITLQVLAGIFIGPLVAMAVNITVPSAPGYGYGLVSTSTGAYVYTATSTVTCTGSASCTPFSVFGSTPSITINGTSGVTSVTGGFPILSSGGATPNITFGGLSTSTLAVVGNIPYFSGVNTFANVATTSVTITGPFVVPSMSVIGSSGAITYTGLATTSQPSSSNLLVSNGLAGVYGVATSSETCTYPLSCAAHAVLTGGGAITTNFGTTTNTGIGNNLVLYTSNTGVMLGVATSSSSFSIGGNAATVTTNANLSGVVTSSGNTTSFGSQSAGVLGNAATGNTAPMATSTLFGNAATFLTGGNVGISSTTPAFRFSVNNAGSDFYIDSNGKIVGRDTTNGWSGRISPTHSFVLTVGTTTTWTGTTSAAYVPSLAMPFAGTLQQVRCNATTTAAFLNIAPYIGTTQTTPGSFVASSTVGVEKFTSNNTFSAGNVVSMYVGTSTSSTANQSVSCTFDITET